MAVRLLCDAIPFCYGPAAALDSFLDALFSLLPGAEVDILATGSTRELLERATTYQARLLPIASEDPAALAAVPFEKYDAFFNVCNPVSFRSARGRLPTAYLDFLLWMHRGAAPDYFDADLYLAENYPGTSKWITQRGDEVTNLSLVPPLVRRAFVRKPMPGFLLVGLGGLYSRLTIPGANTNYVPLVLSAVLAALPASRFSHVMIAGPSGIAPVVRELIEPYANVAYVSQSHEQFLEALTRAEAFVSHPGLYAAFEAMLHGVPTCFLPPSNYTQVLQLRHYRELGLAEWSFSWEDASLRVVPDGLPEEEGVREILAVVAEAETSAAPVALTNVIAEFLQRSPAALAETGVRQKTIAATFGTDGPRIAAARFVDWLSSPPRR
jgi:hypothetical protein